MKNLVVSLEVLDSRELASVSVIVTACGGLQDEGHMSLSACCSSTCC